MTEFPLPYSSLKRSQERIAPRKKAEKRVGKLGIVRLSGKAMDDLRMACWSRDNGLCVCCGRPAKLDVPDYHPARYDMAHVRNKRMYGDTLANVKTMRHECHMREHTKGKRNAN